MKRLFVISILLLAIPLLATYRTHDALLDGTLAVNASATATNGPAADFVSRELLIYNTSQIGVTVAFTRAAGSASTIDFAFEVSYDGGTAGVPSGTATWATFYGSDIKIATNTTPVTGTTVRVFYEMAVSGVSHFRLKSVKNNDSGNNITAVNVTVSQ